MVKEYHLLLHVYDNAYGMSLFHYHNNHLVRCPKCNYFLTRANTTRLYSNGVTKKEYTCYKCNLRFVCCSNIKFRKYQPKRVKVYH